MRKSLIAIVTAAIMSVSFTASANLGTHMKTLAKQFEIVSNTDDSATFVAALKEMRTAAESSAKVTPDSLEGSAPDSKEMQAYQQGYVDLIAVIDNAIELANAGKMAEAKAAAEKLAEIRNINHKQFR